MEEKNVLIKVGKRKNNIHFVCGHFVCGLTVETTPACDVARLVVGECRTGLWQASQLDFVTDSSTFLQLEQGNVIAT